MRAAGPDRFATAAAVADLLAAYDPAYLPVTAEAVDADTLDGKHADAFASTGHDHDSDYLAADGKAQTAGHADSADDADTLDGMDSSDFTAATSPLVPVAVVNVDRGPGTSSRSSTGWPATGCAHGGPQRRQRPV